MAQNLQILPSGRKQGIHCIGARWWYSLLYPQSEYIKLTGKVSAAGSLLEKKPIVTGLI
jgi:hypothetical protein